LQQHLVYTALFRSFSGYSGAKASRTFPAICPRKPYPEFTKSIPPAVVGPGPLMAPPCPDTPLTVVNSRAVSKSQITRPSAVECARKCPSRDPEKTTPGMTVTAADCAGLQPLRVSGHGGGSARHSCFPSASCNASSPPPPFG